VQLSVVRKKLNVVADRGRQKLSVVTNGATGKRRGAAERGHGKVERGHRWGWGKLSVVTDGTAGKRLAWSHFCPYRIRIASYI